MANPGCCRSNTHMVGAEGQGPIMGIPLGSSEGCSRLGGCAQCSSQHGTAGHSSAAAPDALRQPQQCSLCEGRWPGRGEKVSASLPETPVEQDWVLYKPKELWNMSWPPPLDHEGPPKCFPPPQLHLSYPQEHQINCWVTTPPRELHPN